MRFSVAVLLLGQASGFSYLDSIGGGGGAKAPKGAYSISGSKPMKDSSNSQNPAYFLNVDQPGAAGEAVAPTQQMVEPAVPNAPASSQGGISNYLDAVSPQNNAPAKSYGISNYSPSTSSASISAFSSVSHPAAASPTTSSSSAQVPVSTSVLSSSSAAAEISTPASGNYLDSFSPKSAGPAKSYGISGFKPGQPVKTPSSSSYLDRVASAEYQDALVPAVAPAPSTNVTPPPASPAPAPAPAPAPVQASSTGNYLDAFAPKSSGPPKSYGVSSFKPGQAPKSSGSSYLDQMTGTTSASSSSTSFEAPSSPVPAQASTTSGNYLDAFSPKSSGPPKSYGVSSFKPGQAPKSSGSSYLDQMVGQTLDSPSFEASAPVAATPVAAVEPVTEVQVAAPTTASTSTATPSYSDALAPPQSNAAPSKSYSPSSYKPTNGVQAQGSSYLDNVSKFTSYRGQAEQAARPKGGTSVSSGSYLDKVSAFTAFSTTSGKGSAPAAGKVSSSSYLDKIAAHSSMSQAASAPDNDAVAQNNVVGEAVNFAQTFLQNAQNAFSEKVQAVANAKVPDLSLNSSQNAPSTAGSNSDSSSVKGTRVIASSSQYSGTRVISTNVDGSQFRATRVIKASTSNNGASQGQSHQGTRVIKRASSDATPVDYTATRVIRSEGGKPGELSVAEAAYLEYMTAKSPGEPVNGAQQPRRTMMIPGSGSNAGGNAPRGTFVVGKSGTQVISQRNREQQAGSPEPEGGNPFSFLKGFSLFRTDDLN